MIGTHFIKSWSSTQNNAISLSSGEAELYAIVKGIGTGIGVQQYLVDLGVNAELRVHTDSAAAQGICKRVGLGTQRHIAVNSLWVQEKLRRKEFTLYKIKGEDNPADLLTKHLPSDKMVRALRFMSAEYREGRPIAAPHRKMHEHVLGEDMEWQLAETARNELDDEEVEMRLAAEVQDAECADRQGPHLPMEEIMSAGCADQQESDCVREDQESFSEHRVYNDNDQFFGRDLH